MDEKSNEITAIPELLDSIDLSGAVVSIDAMGDANRYCLGKIVESEADYVLALKGSHKYLAEDVKDVFTGRHKNMIWG